MARAGGARDEENGVASEARGGAETTPLLAPGGDGAGVQEEEVRARHGQREKRREGVTGAESSRRDRIQL